MFTGIIETIGDVVDVQQMDAAALRITFESEISSLLKVDQSISHDGVCLTVISQGGNRHVVDVVAETIRRSRFGDLKTGDRVNLERAVQASARLDGHIVQGHVDSVGQCTKVQDGYYSFSFPSDYTTLVVEKGSICINGVSLTIASLHDQVFSVALIPYTLEHTNLGMLHPGHAVNLEFDILGKYVQKHLMHYSPRSEPKRIVL